METALLEPLLDSPTDDEFSRRFRIHGPITDREVPTDEALAEVFRRSLKLGPKDRGLDFHNALFDLNAPRPWLRNLALELLDQGEISETAHSICLSTGVVRSRIWLPTACCRVDTPAGRCAVSGVQRADLGSDGSAVGCSDASTRSAAGAVLLQLGNTPGLCRGLAIPRGEAGREGQGGEATAATTVDVGYGTEPVSASGRADGLHALAAGAVGDAGGAVGSSLARSGSEPGASLVQGDGAALRAALGGRKRRYGSSSGEAWG